MNRERFFIIDAFAHIFRAYYAVKGLDNNAVFGFTTMLKKLMADEKPDYIAVAFDSSSDTFRKKLYPQYKANRETMPEDLRPQIPLIKELVAALNLPLVEMPGFEADDIMGTLAHRAAADGIQAVIVSGDKDMLQLVRKQDVVIYDPKKELYFLDEAGVPAHFGCKPEQIIDLLTIWGDSADNIPGVPGVGEKGAKKLLETYGSLDNVYTHLDEITAKRTKEGLETARDKIELMRTLVTIRTDLDLPFDRQYYRTRGADGTRLHDLFVRLNFKSLLKDIPMEMARITKQYELLNDLGRLREWIARIEARGFFVFDTETTSLEPVDAQLVGMSLALDRDNICYIPLRHRGYDPAFTAEAEALLKPLFQNPALVRCAHNAKYDFSVLTARGWAPSGRFDDTMLMSYLIAPTETRHGLDELAENLLRYRTIHFEDVCGSGPDQISFDQADLALACNYAAEDADICLQLYEKLEPRLNELGLRQVYEQVERPLVPVLARMELAGIRIDPPYLAEMSNTMTHKIEILEEEIYALAGERFNIKSTKQLGELLFEKMQLPTIKKTSKTGSFSTDQYVLERLAEKGHALPVKLLEYRELTKLKSTYVDSLPKMVNPSTGRIHASFNQFVAATGRLSSANPNLQNIPIRSEAGAQIRAAFVPDQGNVFVAADYSQIELRLMAHFSGDQTLIDGFTKGEDIHRRTASEVFGIMPDLVTSEMRSMAKSINFGLIYGMGEMRLSQELNIPRKKAKEYIDAYFEKMPSVLSFRDAVIAKAKQDGEVRTFSGRRRDLPEINSRNHNLQAQGERLAVNTLIQGSAAEVIKLAMIRLSDALAEELPSARLLLQVHDELLIECQAADAERAARLLERTMEQVVNFKVPLTAGAHVGINWKEAK